jgi:hypothetical protein
MLLFLLVEKKGGDSFFTQNGAKKTPPETSMG